MRILAKSVKDGKWGRGIWREKPRMTSVPTRSQERVLGPFTGQGSLQESSSGVRWAGLWVPEGAPNRQLAKQMWSSEEKSG